MNCNHCGTPLSFDAKFCPNCGAPVQQSPLNPTPSYSSAHSVEPQVGFLEAVILFFSRYTDFSTRSRRSEYWWVCLFSILVSAAMNIIFGDRSVIPSLVTLALFVPTLALSVRRLHDVGKSWVWLLWNLCPIVGPIVLLVQYLKDSGPDNQWGPDPKAYR